MQHRRAAIRSSSLNRKPALNPIGRDPGYHLGPRPRSEQSRGSRRQLFFSFLSSQESPEQRNSPAIGGELGWARSPREPPWVLSTATGEPERPPGKGCDENETAGRDGASAGDHDISTARPKSLRKEEKLQRQRFRRKAGKV